MRWTLLLLIIAFFIGITACSWSSSQWDTPSLDESEDTQIAAQENEVFNRVYSTNGEQSDRVFERIIEMLANEDSAALVGLFSSHTIELCEDIDKDLLLLFDFFDGEMVEYKRYGPGSRESKDNGQYTKEIFATYDVTTTSGVYRIAIEFCTIHSLTPNKIGLTSLYIIKAEDSDMDFAYWGNEAWGAGIVIDEGKEASAS